MEARGERHADALSEGRSRPASCAQGQEVKQHCLPPRVGLADSKMRIPIPARSTFHPRLHRNRRRDGLGILQRLLREWQQDLSHYPGLPLRVCPVRRLRVPQPIPTTWRLAVAYQLSGPGGRLPTVRQVRQVRKMLGLAEELMPVMGSIVLRNCLR